MPPIELLALFGGDEQADDIGGYPPEVQQQMQMGGHGFNEGWYICGVACKTKENSNSITVAQLLRKEIALNHQLSFSWFESFIATISNY